LHSARAIDKLKLSDIVRKNPATNPKWMVFTLLEAKIRPRIGYLEA
jgi:hypothetical protein